MRLLKYVIGMAMALLIGSVAPAQAADTTVTFTIQGGALTISAPASINLGNSASDTTLQGTIGPVTVTDLRGTLLGSWTAGVTSTDFTTGGGTANETIPKADAAYASGAATATSGVGTFAPGQLTVQLAAPLTGQVTAFTAAALVGNNTVTWNPTLRVTIPNSAVAGTYTGTVTHSVA
ncbi:hypothetical protein GT755_17450 [Herbidospora sp. NEAU-GS84]|uniref:WxL domain-containing protein n=1 Tax=Herbidospora solisilvae TaxID=2696284 RepID=A0A7C9NIJ3_9ACTN|nr:hypothetical protein [Herbidospora solisilvae]NAS23472.1 hypothetical protein [Herbidospora solisilvae]